MNNSEQQPPLERLRNMWAEALAGSGPGIDDNIDALLRCSVVSIRYALLTQLLGKVTDHSRDALSIQRGEADTAEEAGRWDARSFCQSAVVPWVAEAGQVLGTSPDPYVNNPLRRPRLDAGYEPRRNRPLWDRLVEVLNDVQKKDDPEYSEVQLRRCLASLAQRYNELSVEFEVPQRVSIDVTLNLVAKFLETSSGGERPQVVVAALMRTIGQRFGIFDRVVRQAINESDTARDRPGDIICYQEDELVLAVEVKDRTVELQDVETAIGKARRTDVREVLFASVSPETESSEITERVQREFGLGINVYQLRIDTLLRVVLTVGGEIGRNQFLTLVGEELNDRVTQPSHKLDWQDLLRRL